MLDNTVIRAPFGGVVIAKSAPPGEMISPMSAGGSFTRTGIGTIVDMESLEVQERRRGDVGRVSALVDGPPILAMERMNDH